MAEWDNGICANFRVELEAQMKYAFIVLGSVEPMESVEEDGKWELYHIVAEDSRSAFIAAFDKAVKEDQVQLQVMRIRSSLRMEAAD